MFVLESPARGPGALGQSTFMHIAQPGCRIFVQVHKLYFLHIAQSRDENFMQVHKI